MPRRTRINIYIDSFNLYYRLLKKHPSRRWLNLVSLSEAICDKLLGGGNSQIGEIYFFTAPVKSTEEDEEKSIRQNAYLRALRHHGVKVILGYFLRHPRSMRPKNPADLKSEDPKAWIKVWYTEEKGSDVNLATAMIRDAAQDKIDAVLLISNDGDFRGAIECVKEVFDKEVYIVGLGKGRDGTPTRGLAQIATGVFNLSPSLVRRHQFPDEIPNTRIHKPAKWRIAAADSQKL